MFLQLSRKTKVIAKTFATLVFYVIAIMLQLIFYAATLVGAIYIVKCLWTLF